MKNKTTLISPFIALIVPLVLIVGINSSSLSQENLHVKNKANACLKTFALKEYLQSKFTFNASAAYSSALEKVFR